jgi:hypothetical protein
MRHGCLAPLIVAMATAIRPAYAQTPPAPPQASASTPSIVGAWTLNRDLSDQPGDRSGGSGEARQGGGQGGRRGGGGYGGRRGGGGFGGGGFGGGRPTDNRSPEEVERMRNALRDELEAPDHLTITDSGATVIITTGDGRTTRLSTDGKKIKDESTNVERKTRKDAGKIVSEVSGLGQGKITETYSIDAARKQLHVTLDIEGPQRKTTVNRIYDADAQ